MPTLDTLVTRFARCVDLFRDPGAKQEQKAEFRELIGLLREVPVTFRLASGALEVNGARSEAAGVTALVQRLELHGIAAIELPHDPPAGQLFALLAALADQPGMEDVPSRLRAAGVDRLRVGLMPLAPPETPAAAPRAPTSTPEHPARRDAAPPPARDGAERGSRSLGTEGILRGESWTDIKAVPIQGVPLVTHDPPQPPAAEAMPTELGAARPKGSGEGAEELSLSIDAPSGAKRAVPPSASQTPAARESARSSAPTAGPPVPPAPTPPAPAAPTPRAAPAAPAARAAPGGRASPAAPTPGPAAVPLPSEVASQLADLERDPEGPMVGDLLAELTRYADQARKENRLEQLLRVIVRIIAAERSVPETSGGRRQYSIALRRIYSKPLLEALAHLVPALKHRADAVTALQRGGADAVEVLMDLLVAAPTVSERRAVFDALRQMTEGTEQLVHMLDHPQWFVARNVAELIGELGMEEAVPALARQLGHADERVRKAVSLALAKIGTRSAAEPLRRALRDPSGEVRLQVALGIGGRKSMALAMPLVVALEEEKDEAVVRELVLALGRIGSPDAVQALIKFAQPAGRLFGRKPSGLRLAAVEALRLAATPAALGTLEGLAGDSDREVRAAARESVTELKRRPAS